MPRTLTLVHDEHFDLLLPADAPEGEASLGSYTVLNREGEEELREKYRFTAPGNTTTVTLPDDYDVDNLTAVLHLVQTLRDRHSSAITGMYGTDPALTQRLASVLNVPVIEAEQ